MLYTGDADAELLYSGLDSGARGYALKAGSMEELVGRSSTIAAAAPTSIRGWTASCSRRGPPPSCRSSRRASARSCT